MFEDAGQMMKHLKRAHDSPGALEAALLRRLIAATYNNIGKAVSFYSNTTTEDEREPEREQESEQTEEREREDTHDTLERYGSSKRIGNGPKLYMGRLVL